MFKKWKSIENHYRNKIIEKFFSTYPELYNEVFFVQEKIDGSNFSVILYPDGHREFAKRSGIITDNFIGYKEAFKDPIIEEFINAVTLYAINKEVTIQLVGELFGKGIQNRIHYGDGKYWRWYATYIDGKLNSIKEDYEFVKELYVPHSDFLLWDVRAPILSEFIIEKGKTFQDKVKEIDININSLLTPTNYVEENFMEGVVIRPYEKDYSINHQYFMIKYKNENYQENKSNKKHKPQKQIDSKVQQAVDNIFQYINENRTKSLYSKHGEMESTHDMGNYIKWYLQDVYEDFNKDNENVLKDFTKDERKYINKTITKEIVKELRQCL